jgi:hypothetical protein
MKKITAKKSDSIKYGVCHQWGDKWFEKNGLELSLAMNYIYTFVKRWSKCSLIMKEKYGSVRYEYLFPPLRGTLYCTWIYRKWVQYGKWILKIAVHRACKKYPAVMREIVDDYYDMVDCL